MGLTRTTGWIVVLLTLTLVGCQTAGGPGVGGTGVGTATAIGGLGGAAAGGLLGAALGGGGTGIAAGTILGGLLGVGIGYALDQRSQQLQAQTVARSLETAPSGTTATWVNPDNGIQGTVTPVRTYQTQTGTYCREFQQTIIVGGQPQQAHGTACRQPDGSWRIMN
jgi:surface antigen